MREVKYLSLGGNVVSDKWMDAPLEDREVWGQEHATICRTDLKIASEPGEVQQNEQLGFAAFSHRINSLA